MLSNKTSVATPPLRVLATSVERTIALPGNSRLLLGAQWNPVRRQLTIFEGSDSQLTTVDSLGQVISTVGRKGNGPAEFRLSPVYVGSRQKFRVANDGRVLALDDRFGHVFSGALQSQEVTFGATAGILATDAHVARIRNGWIVSMANRRNADAAARSEVQLYLVHDGGGESQAAEPVFKVRNVAWQAPPSTGRAPDLPYDGVYRRTWDAAGSTMAVVSYRHFSVCTGSFADSASWRSWPTAAVRRRVTAAERERVLKERFGAATGPIPVMGGQIEEYFRGKWPETAPFYHDVTALDDSTFAALRLDPEGGITADLLDTRHGYRGSMKIPPSRFVIGGYSEGLLVLNYPDGEIEFLRAGLDRNGIR